MKRYIQKQYITRYLFIFIIFRVAFHFLTPVYIDHPSETVYPIDVRVLEGRVFFDSGYVRLARETFYKPGVYFYTFLPVDLVFPVFYSLLFASCLLYCTAPALKKLLSILIVAGAICDWLEDISFAIYLRSGSNSLPVVVAFFTTIKTILMAVNILFTLYWLFVAVKTHYSNKAGNKYRNN